MAQLPPNLRRGIERFERIEDDRSCAKCSYNLRGLTTGDRCPECGTPTGSAVASEQWISEAPISFLRPFSKGAMLTGVMMPVHAAVTVAMFVWPNFSWITLLAIITGSLYAVGVYLLTTARPSTKTTDGTREWSTVRWLCRSMQWSWCLSALTFGAHVAIVRANPTAPSGYAALWLSGCLILVGIGGLVPLLVYLVRIAHWAGDTEFADRLKLLPLFLPVAAALAASAGFIAPQLTGGIGTFLLVPLAGVSIVFLLFTGYSALTTFWTLASMGFWVIRNRTESLESGQRRSARIVKRIEDGMARRADLKPKDDKPIDLT